MLLYLPPDLDLGPAAELLTDAYGATKTDAEAFLLEWIEAGRLELQHAPPPDGGRVEQSRVARSQIDLSASTARFRVRYPAVRSDPDPDVPSHWTLGAFEWVARVTVSRARLQALAAEASIAQPPPLPVASQRGRKPHGATRDGEILAEFDRLVAAGKVSFAHGGKTAAATAIQAKFPEYKVDSITRKITPVFEELAAK